MPEDVSIHSFSVSPERVARMNDRFARVGLQIAWETDVMTVDDPRNRERSIPFAAMWGHLGALRSFLGTGRELGVVCEDDVMIRRSFADDLAVAVSAFTSLGLDVLLLGYLLSYRPVTVHGDHELIAPQFAYLSYRDDLWGAQMYLVSRRSAGALVEAFADGSRVAGPYSPDWTITKFGRRACIYPMLAVEEGESRGVSDAHARFHRECRLAQFDPTIHI